MAVPILWRNRRQRYNLEGERCPACDRAVFPPRQVCPYCSREHSPSGDIAATGSLGPILSMPELRFDPRRLSESEGILQEGKLPEEAPQHEHVFMLPKEMARGAVMREAGDD